MSSSGPAGRTDLLETLARIGYATKGLLYLLVGGLATGYALGRGGRISDGQGALESMSHRPMGMLLPWAVAVGLGAYALWRLVQAVWDPESTRRDARRIGKRIGFGVSGLAHAGLCVAVVQLAFGHRQQGGAARQTHLAEVLRLPGGALLVAGAALAVLGVAGYELYAAYSSSFMQRIRTGHMSVAEQKWARRAGQLGLMAHGVVFGVIGYFLLQVARSGRSNQFKGLAGALREIAARTHSGFLFGVFAVGLIGYAVHMLFTARYLRIGWDA